MNTESGSMITGKWINPANGMIINVTGTVIDENNEMIVMTDKGVVDINSFSSNFIQCDDETLAQMTEMRKEQHQSSSQVTIATETIPQPDPIITHQPEPVVTQTKNDSTSIIDKLFNKIESKPNINIEIDWDDFPDEQVKMLINFLDVDKMDISRYIFDKYLDEYALLGALSKFLEKRI